MNENSINSGLVSEQYILQEDQQEKLLNTSDNTSAFFNRNNITDNTANNMNFTLDE